MTKEQAEYDVVMLPNAIRAAKSMGTGSRRNNEDRALRHANVNKLIERLKAAKEFLAKN